MTNGYERKLAEKTAKRVVRSAMTEWYKYGNIGIDDILKRKGFTKPWNSTYKFEYSCWTGSRGYLITLDTYDLVHKRDGKITFTVA